MIIISLHNFIDRATHPDAEINEFFGIIGIDDPDSGHNRSPVHQAYSLTEFNIDRCKSQLLINFRSWSSFSFIKDLALANEYKCQMGKLYKVATGSYTTVFKNQGRNILVNKFLKQQYN